MVAKAVYHGRTRPLLMPVSRSTQYKSGYISMRNVKRVCFNVRIGANADTDVTIGLMQAKNVNGASDKELIIRTGDVFECDGAAAAESDKDKWTKTTVTNSDAAGSVVTVSGLDNLHYKIYIDGDRLDSNNNFDCVGVQVYGISAAVLLSVDVELEETRYQGDPSDNNLVPSNSIDAGATG